MKSLLGRPNWVPPPEAAEFLGVSVGTLAIWRCTKRYDIPYTKVGSKVRYYIDDLEAWLESRRKAR